jgi:hypothetical protein
MNMTDFESDGEKAEAPGEKRVPVPLFLFSWEVFIDFVYRLIFNSR